MLIYVLVCVLVGVTHAQNGIQVNTTEGTIEGSKAADGNYYAFYGVPYAGPTSGENRFQAPKPPSAYPGIFHAINSNVICAQPSTRGLIGVEDCLTLSIFTNNMTTSKPVFVWLNAEEYTTTSTTLYSYRRLVEEGLVVVSLNFRLSIFGFLCLGIQEAPGNAGLRDVIQGLHWIKENIAGFGGNASNVVLAGHGSGAAIVDLITMSPRAENLVHKAITLSGSALAPWAIAYDPVGYAEALGAKLSYTGKTRAELAKLLVTTNSNVLGSALNDFKFTNNTPLFAPCIENVKLSPNDTVLPDAPISLLRTGNYSHIPYIAGYVSKEGTLRAEEAVVGDWLAKMRENFTNFLQVDLKFGANQSNVAQSIRQFYFGGGAIDMANIEDYLAYEGDTLIIVSSIRGARERGATSSSDVRLFEFAYVGTKNSDWPYNQITLDGVRHGGILNYLFDYDLRPSDEVVMKKFLNRLINFSNTGSPQAPEYTDWMPISKQIVNYLYYGGKDGPIANQTSIYIEEAKNDPHSIRMVFWNHLYADYYIPPTPVSSAGKTACFVLTVLFCQLFVGLF